MLKQTYNADIKHQDTGCITIQKMWIELWLKGSDSGNLFFLYWYSLVIKSDQKWQWKITIYYYLLNL